MEEFTDLIAMKKSRKKPQKGDIFVVQPLQNIFYYGKVIETDIRSKDSFVNGMFLILVYDKMSKSKDSPIPSDLDRCDLLIAPTCANYCK